MEIDEYEEPQLKCFSRTIAWILGVSIMSILLVVILGVWGKCIFSEGGIEPISAGMPLCAGKDINEDDPFEFKGSPETSSEHENVPIAQSCAGTEHDVAPGWVNMCIDIPDVLPICVTDCYLEQNWNMRAYSYGGYHPDWDGTTTITLDQTKTGAGGTVDVTWEYVGTMGHEDFCCTDWYTYYQCEEVCEWEWCEWCFWGVCIPYPCYVCEWECEPHTVCVDAQWCTFDVYEAHFSVDTDGGNEAIQLESNRLPSVTAYCGGCGPEMTTTGPDSLGKEVNVTLNSDWTGCGEPDQQFEIV